MYGCIKLVESVSSLLFSFIPNNSATVMGKLAAGLQGSRFGFQTGA